VSVVLLWVTEIKKLNADDKHTTPYTNHMSRRVWLQGVIHAFGINRAGLIQRACFTFNSLLRRGIELGPHLIPAENLFCGLEVDYSVSRTFIWE